jgi:ATP-dependent DNA ligase
MAPTLVHGPLPTRPGWIYEEKVDGWRILAYKDGARVRLLSRTGVDHAERCRDVRPERRHYLERLSATGCCGHLVTHIGEEVA